MADPLREMPVCWAVSTSLLQQLCSHCMQTAKSDRKLQRCGKCEIMHYCCKECQTSDWVDHKVECKRIATALSREKPPWVTSISKDFPDDGLRLIARIASRLKKGENLESSSCIDRSFEQLISHADDIRESEEHREDFDKFCSLYGYFINRNLSDEDREKLIEIYGKLKINAFGIKNNRLKSIGIGLYLSLCRLDHSCEPNARILFDGREAHVISVKNGRFSESEAADLAKLKHSYIDNLLPLEQRRKALQKDYFFHCECRGCLNDKRNRTMLAFSCMYYPDCQGEALPTASEDCAVCTKCGTELDDFETPKKIQQITSDALDKLDFPFVPDDKRMELCTKSAAMQEGCLHDRNIYRVRILRHSYESCIAMGKWRDASMYGELVLKAYRFYYSAYDAWLLIFSENLATVYVNTGQPESIRDAHDLLEVCQLRFRTVFGENSSAVARVAELAAKVDKLIEKLNESS